MVSRLTYTLDCCDAKTLAAFWTEVLGYSLFGPHRSFWSLVPPEGVDEPWFVLQEVDEPKRGKNRMHLDIHVVDIDAEATRLEGLGAKRVSSSAFDEHGTQWHLMADPEGNELCVCNSGAGSAG